MLKKALLIISILLFNFVQIPFITSQERLSVNPVSFSVILKNGQMNTKFLEVSNLGKSYISVKTEFDTNWISLFPSKFILLPSETKKVMAIFSQKDGTTLKKHDKILFRSKDGIEKSVLVTVVNNSSELTPDIADTPHLKKRMVDSSDEDEPINTVSNKVLPERKNTSVKPKSSPQQTKISPKKSKTIPQRKPKQTIKNVKKFSKDYKLLADSLQIQIKRLESELKKSEQEVSNLIAQIKRQDKKISELLSNLTEDMITELRDLYAFSNTYFDKEIQNESVELSWSGDSFSILIDGQTGFLSGSIRLENKGKKILSKVATIANTKGKYDKILTIKGHTDSYPIKRSYRSKIPSNWELSALRAATVTRILEEDLGVAGEKLSISAYSRFRPIASNLTAEGRRKNRRIEVVVACRTQEAGLFVTSEPKDKK